MCWNNQSPQKYRMARRGLEQMVPEFCASKCEHLEKIKDMGLFVQNLVRISKWHDRLFPLLNITLWFPLDIQVM